MIDNPFNGAAPEPAEGDRDDLSGRPTIRDVSRAYRMFLGREVESLTAAGHHIAGSASLWDLIGRIRHSAEAKYHRIGEALVDLGAFHTQSDIDAFASPKQVDRLRAEVVQAWERTGLGVHHHRLRMQDVRYADRSDRWNIELRLQAGESEAQWLLDLCARHGCSLSSHQMVVVLGDEAAFRLARALSPLVGHYLGVEVSASLFARAERALAASPIENARAVLLPEFWEGQAAFDIFYSVMTLQHAPPPAALDLLGHCLERIRLDGLALFQLPAYLHEYRFDMEGYLAGAGRNPEGEIHAVPQREVLALLARQGFTLLEIMPDGRILGYGASYFYVARKDRA